MWSFFFFQAEDGIRDYKVTGVQTCALPISTAFWKPRPSLDPQAHMGPLVSKEQMDRVMGYIEAGKRDRSEERRVGESVDLGGRRIIKKKKRRRKVVEEE